MATLHRTMALTAGLMLWPLGALSADQVCMQNGDIFNGTVLSVSTNSVVLNNENLGIVNVPRGKVTAIRFGSAAAVGTSSKPPLISNAAAVSPEAGRSDLTAALRGLRDQTNLLQQVQSQVMGSAASPEADAKFNELVDGLSTGKINMNDLRSQASEAAQQIKELKKELGPNDDSEMDSYLTILNSFLQETAPGDTATNVNRPTAKIPSDSVETVP